jgi:tetratricopeptide (TPR) repeat protein
VTERSQSWGFRGKCLKELQRYDEAEESYRRAVEVDHSRREPFLKLASICSARGRFADAVDWARESLGISRTSAYPELDANYSWRPHSLLYWNLFWLGRKAEAREHWQIFLSLAPEYNVPEHHARMFPQVTKTHEGSPSEVTGVVAQIRAADSDESSKPSKDPDPQT